MRRSPERSEGTAKHLYPLRKRPFPFAALRATAALRVTAAVLAFQRPRLPQARCTPDPARGIIDDVRVRTKLNRRCHREGVVGNDAYLPLLLQLVRTFRESLTLKPAAASFRQGWQEARQGITYPLATLWDDIDAD
jgi:hypothetical protein